MDLRIELLIGGGTWNSFCHFGVGLYSLTPAWSDPNHPCSRQCESSKAQALHQDRRFSREHSSWLLCPRFICEVNILVLIIRMRAVAWHSEEGFKSWSPVSLLKLPAFIYTASNTHSERAHGIASSHVWIIENELLEALVFPWLL